MPLVSPCRYGRLLPASSRDGRHAQETSSNAELMGGTAYSAVPGVWDREQSQQRPREESVSSADSVERAQSGRGGRRTPSTLPAVCCMCAASSPPNVLLPGFLGLILSPAKKGVGDCANKAEAEPAAAVWIA